MEITTRWGQPERGAGSADVEVPAPARRGHNVEPLDREGFGAILQFAARTGGRIMNRAWRASVPCEVERDARVAARGVMRAEGLTGEERRAIIDSIAETAMGRGEEPRA